MEDVRAQVAELYRRYGAMVHRRALWVLGNEADAHEVLQEVFAALLERPAPAEVRARSLYSVTTQASLKRLQNQKNSSRLLRESVSAGPARTPLAFNEAVRMRQTLERLPAQLAEVAVYYFIDELSLDDIASITGCSQRTIGNLLQRVVEWGRTQGQPWSSK
jgi:RNA polymerase sigma factor (sigma-70 family)